MDEFDLGRHHGELLRLVRPELGRMAAQDPEPLMREMARDLLGGGISPRQAFSFGPYAEILGGRAERFLTLFRELTDEQRGELAARGQHVLTERLHED